MSTGESMTKRVTNLRGVYARTAEHADDAQLAHLIRSLEAEPDQGNPHIAQALEAFRGEAQRRATERAAAP
jgi:hypothetical protein